LGLRKNILDVENYIINSTVLTVYFRTVKSRLRWARYLACMGYMRNAPGATTF
jgi:hypothetical protein